MVGRAFRLICSSQGFHLNDVFSSFLPSMFLKSAKPGKPGFANICHACSPSAPLLPAEAKEVALAQKSKNADALFRNEIVEKRKAERSGNWQEADRPEDEIQRLDKARIKVPSRSKP